MLSVEGPTIYAAVDGARKPIFETTLPVNVGPKLVLGSPERKCNTFIGCVKDLVCIICMLNIFVIKMFKTARGIRRNITLLNIVTEGSILTNPPNGGSINDILGHIK